jgi:hypothetical protein
VSTPTVTLTQDDPRPPAQPDHRPEPGAQGRPGRRGPAALASLIVNFVAPLAAYYLIRPHTGSSALALAVSGAIPIVWTLALLAVRRRLDPLGVISVVTFGLGVLVSWASGGNALALELQEPVLTGLLGLACLVSVAINRPLHPVILRWLGRNNPRYTDIARRAEHRNSMVITAILGLTLAAHAAALVILAVTQPASTFVALQHPVGLPILGVGLAAIFLYRSRMQAGQPGPHA